MSEKTEYEIQKKREYHREWRKNHPESVRAAQVKYWTKKAEEARQAPEIRSAENGVMDNA